MIVAESASAALGPWLSFYVMTASSAAALTGLMFVVITLVTGAERVRRAPDGISAFSTPTVVHFCAVLFVSAILCAPWRSLVGPAVLLGVAGLYGLAYVLRVMAITRRLSAYRPDLEDWAWYTILPLGAYAVIVMGAVLLPLLAVDALFALATGVMALIIIGIRNSWDVVTFIAIKDPDEPPDPPSGSSG
ncbi:MAG TPA: hypothetical protein VME66_13325 [Candidatus Acidoferrales bacterium]|nr:hypothetical protein [Candidatus Acidoferrales bacterium]